MARAVSQPPWTYSQRFTALVVLDKELQFMNWELQLTRPVLTHRSDLPEIIRTLGDAVDMIDEHLPETLRIRPVWQQVKDMLVTAAETRTAQDVGAATALLERALEEEGWLHQIDITH